MSRSTSLTSEERSTRSRIGAHALHAKYDSRDLTANARKTFLDKFEKQVDPDGVLTPEERARRAAHAKRSYFLNLAFKSAQARRARRSDAGGE